MEKPNYRLGKIGTILEGSILARINFGRSKRDISDKTFCFTHCSCDKECECDEEPTCSCNPVCDCTYFRTCGNYCYCVDDCRVDCDTHGECSCDGYSEHGMHHQCSRNNG